MINNLHYSLGRTHDGLVFLMDQTVQKEGGYFGFLKYYTKLMAEKSINLRITNLNPADMKEEVKQVSSAYLYENVGESKFFIPENALKEVHHPIEGLKRLLDEPSTTVPRKNTKRLVAFLKSIGIKQESIGIAGSMLIGADSEESDMDVFFYDPAGYKEMWSHLLNKPSREFTFRRFEDWQAYEVHGNAVGITPEEYARHNLRKVDRGFFNGTEFSFFAINPNPQVFNQESASFGTNEVSLTGIVTDDSKGLFAPSIYEVEVTSSSISLPHKIKMMACEREFRHQVFAGENFSAKGRLVLDNGAYLILGPTARPNHSLLSAQSDRRAYK
jgi:predicted nucleotidyltransferase